MKRPLMTAGAFGFTFVFASAIGLAGGQVIHVNALASGANDGTSWVDAFRDLQDAFDAAADSMGQVAEIWVAAGVYKPDRGTGDPSKTFFLVNGVGLYGGFAGWETRRNQRDPVSNQTILSGDLLDNDNLDFVPTSDCCTIHESAGCDNARCQAAVCELHPICCFDDTHGFDWDSYCPLFASILCCDECNPDRCDNSHHVLTAMGSGSTTVLDGFTIISGHPRGLHYPDNSGGGLLNISAGPTVKNCAFTNNDGPGRGAGISNTEGSTPLITHCDFIENRNNAIGNTDGSDATIESCTFVRNRSGRGAVLGVDSTLLVIDCLFDGNVPHPITVSKVGGISSFDAATIIGCRFINGVNTVGVLGNGPTMLVDCEFTNNTNRAAVLNEDAVLVGCRFTNNYYDGDGGALSASGTLHLSNCVFTQNSAEVHGGAISMGPFATVVADDCTFSHNSANRRGGTVRVFSASFIAKKCTFADNFSNLDGGAINNFNGVLQISDCIFERNSTVEKNQSGGAIYTQGSADIARCVFRNDRASGGGAFRSEFDTSATLQDCVFVGNTSSFSGAAVSLDYDSTANIERCSFIGNHCPLNGAGLRNRGDTTVTNCVFWDNTTDAGMTESAQINNTGAPHLQIDYSIVQGWTGLLGGVGNTGTDPLLVDPDGADDTIGTQDDNVRLSPDSPSINAGDPAYVPGPTAADLDRHARKLCGRVDIGAYEFGIGDYNCDRVVELSDFANLPACMTGPGGGPYTSGCEAYDFSAGSAQRIDLHDFASFQNLYGQL